MTALDERRCIVLLAVQQALLGEITANLRAVTVEYDARSIRLEAFFDRPPNDQDEEAMSLVETEIMALFPSDHSVRVILDWRPEPQLIPKDRAWVYFRKEALME